MKNFFHLLAIIILLFSWQRTSIAQQNSNFSVNNINVAFPFFDNVEDTSLSTTYWQRNSAEWKMVSATSKSGANVWSMLPTTGSYVYLTLASGIDLSSAPNPYFSFWTRKSDGGTGAFSLEVSTNGGTNWTAISQLSFNGTQYRRFQSSLNSYRQANVLLRIGFYAPYGGTYYLDDITIDNAPTPQSLVLSNPNNNGMKISWGQSTAADFFKYRVIISNTASDVNDYNVASSISGNSETRVFDFFNKSTIDTIIPDLTFTNKLYYAKIYEQDSQDLINQGSDRADLSTTFTVTSETAPFVQNFEGSHKLAADLPWAVTSDDAGETGHSASNAYEDSPNGNYPNNADRRLVMQVNFSGVQRPLLKFNHKYSFEQGSDFGNLDISKDNINWTTIASFTGNSGGEWESRTYDIGILKENATGFIRFRTVSNGSNTQDGWHIDDIEVFANNNTTAFPFFDNADIDTSSKKAWTAGSLQLKIANDHTGGGQVWALGPSGGSYIYLTLAGRINLSSATNPYISLWAKKANGGTGALSIEVSNDGGLTWAAIYQPSFNGTQYKRFQASLNNYRQANVLIRIGCYAPYGDTYYLDDILIDNAPSPRSLTLLTPTNNGLKVKWGESTAPDFKFYRVVLTTNTSTVNDYFAEVSTSQRTETRVFDIFNKATIETTLTDLSFANTMYYAKIYETDTQELINQGSDRADLSTSFIVTTETAPFIQTFENTFGWAADLPWGVTNSEASEPGHSPSFALEDSPNGNYPPNADRRLVVRINTTGVQKPMLRFNHKYNFEPNADYGYIDYSVDNTTWTTVTGFTGNTAGQWEQRVFDARALKQQNIAYVRFRVTSNGNNNLDGWHLDDVEIFNNSKGQPIPILDGAEVDSVSRKYWIAGQWEIKPLNARTGDYVWALGPSAGSYNYLTVDGYQNFSSSPNPYLSFWVKKANGGTGALSVEVSNDGGFNWTNLAQPSFSGNTYKNYSYSLKNYKQNNVVLRIGAYSPYGDTYLIDDIEIADSTGYTGVEDLAGITPDNFELSQNYPNPFNPSTTIRYALPSESKVTITIFNLLGQEVASLVNDVKSSGYHEVIFKASDLSSGVYLYKISAISTIDSKEFSSTKKLILLK